MRPGSCRRYKTPEGIFFLTAQVAEVVGFDSQFELIVRMQQAAAIIESPAVWA